MKHAAVVVVLSACGFVGDDEPDEGDGDAPVPCPSITSPVLPESPLVIEQTGSFISSGSTFCDRGRWSFFAFEGFEASVPVAVEARAWSLVTGEALTEATNLQRDEGGNWNGSLQGVPCHSAVAFTAQPFGPDGPGEATTLVSFNGPWNGLGFSTGPDEVQVEARAPTGAVDEAGAWIFYPSIGSSFGPLPTEKTDAGDEDDFLATFDAASNLTADGMAFAFFGCKDGAVIEEAW